MTPKRPTSSIMKDATVFIFNDGYIGGQAILAISAEGGLFLAAPGTHVNALALTELKIYFEGPGKNFEGQELVLETIEKLTTAAN